MPIIIDNFYVNTNAPIDNRFVVGGTNSFYQNKDDIEFIYDGLRIWDLNDNVPYYWSGVEWISENSVGVSADSSSEENYIPKFTNGQTIIGKSIIYENPASNHIGLGIIGGSITPNIPNNNTIEYGLHVSGNIKTNNYFIGNGLYISSLNVNNVSTGLLDIRYISHLQSSSSGQSIGIGQYVLFNTGTNNGVTWVATNTLSVANSNNSVKVGVINDNTSTSNNYLSFVQGVGNVQVKINTSAIQFKPSNGQLFLNDGSLGQPIYSFLNSTNSGFYYNQGISTSILGNEITKTTLIGLIVTNRLYLPTSSNNTDVGFGIVWSNNGSTNDININNGFVYQGGTNYNINTGLNDLINLSTFQRLNYYGIGSHIPDNRDTLSSIAGRGTYISGYFGVDIFSGNRLKLKVDEFNDVTINSILNLNNIQVLGGSIGNNRVLSTMKNLGGSSGNNVVIKDWSVRSNTGTDWLTWKHHNGITVDNVWATPNGPDTGQVTASGTLTFWERHPYIHEQYFGSVNRKTLTINSSNPTTQNPFIKVDGNILVGSSTTISPVTSSGNIVIGSGNLLVGTNTIVPSAIVDFTSTTKGVLLPRMTNTQRNSISSAVVGLTIYNTDKKSLDTYNGNAWISNVKTTNIDITGWVLDRRRANLTHNLNNIISYDILLQCIIAEHGYVAGDITKPSPSYDDEDVTIKYNNSTTFDLLVGNNIRVRNISTIGVQNDASVVTPANWRIRVVFYHYSTINQ